MEPIRNERWKEQVSREHHKSWTWYNRCPFWNLMHPRVLENIQVFYTFRLCNPLRSMSIFHHFQAHNKFKTILCLCVVLWMHILGFQPLTFASINSLTAYLCQCGSLYNYHIAKACHPPASYIQITSTVMRYTCSFGLTCLSLSMTVDNFWAGVQSLGLLQLIKKPASPAHNKNRSLSYSKA